MNARKIAAVGGRRWGRRSCERRRARACAGGGRRALEQRERCRRGEEEESVAVAADAGGSRCGVERMWESEMRRCAGDECSMDKVGDLEWDKDGIVGWTVASWAFLSL